MAQRYWPQLLCPNSDGLLPGADIEPNSNVFLRGQQSLWGASMMHLELKAHQTKQEGELAANPAKKCAHHNVKFEVKSGVVTPNGQVNSRYKRDHAETGEQGANVNLFVNNLQVKVQKASSSQ